MLSTLSLSGRVALGMIRRRGLAGFLRKLPPWHDLLRLLFPRTVVFAPDEEVIGGFDWPDGGLVDRETGLVDGWVLSRREPIARVEILVDGKYAGNARIALPHPTLCRGVPDASVCGFRFYIPAAALAAKSQSIRVSFVAHGFSGGTHEFPPQDLGLKPRIVAKPVSPVVLTPAARRNIASTRGQIRVACFAHDLDYGGAQLFLWEFLRRAVADQSLVFTVLAPSDGPLRRDLQGLGIAVEIFREPSKTDAARHDADVATLGRNLAEGRFACVLANTLQGFFAVNAAISAGVPSIWAIHESFSLPTWMSLYAGVRPESAFIHARLTTALEQAAAVTFVAEPTRRLYLGHGSKERLRYIPYGIDVGSIRDFLKGFDRAAVRSRLNIDPGSFVLLCMGNFEARKQQILLAQAFAEISRQHRNALLLLVGELPSLYSAILRHYIRERGIDANIRLVPAAKQTYPWYGIADGFVLLSDVESMPRSLMEAMAFGIPTLATNVYGIPDLVQEGRTGFLVQPNSLRSAVEGLQRLLGLSEVTRKTMGEAAREIIAKDYESRRYVDAYIALIRDLVAQAAAAAPAKPRIA